MDKLVNLDFNLFNLFAQILFTSNDVGKLKVFQAKRVIKNINKKEKINIITDRIKSSEILCLLYLVIITLLG